MDRTVACYQSHAAELRTARFHIEHQSSEPADAGGYLGKTMAYRTLANSVAAFSLLFAVTFADEAQQLPKKAKSEEAGASSAVSPVTENRIKVQEYGRNLTDNRIRVRNLRCTQT